MRLEILATDEVGVLVRFKIGHAHNDRLRPEPGSQGGNPFNQFLDIEFDRTRVACYTSINRLAHVSRLSLVFK